MTHRVGRIHANVQAGQKVGRCGEVGKSVGNGGHIDDPRGLAGLEGSPKEASQEVRPQIVGLQPAEGSFSSSSSTLVVGTLRISQHFFWPKQLMQGNVKVGLVCMHACIDLTKHSIARIECGVLGCNAGIQIRTQRKALSSCRAAAEAWQVQGCCCSRNAATTSTSHLQKLYAVAPQLPHMLILSVWCLERK